MSPDGTRRPRTRIQTFVFAFVVIGVTLSLAWIGPHREKGSLETRVWSLGATKGEEASDPWDGDQATKSSNTPSSTSEEIGGKEGIQLWTPSPSPVEAPLLHPLEPTPNVQDGDSNGTKETEAWHPEPIPETASGEHVSTVEAFSMSIETVEFNKTSYQDVPVLERGDGRFALLSPSMVLMWDQHHLHWHLENSLDPLQFREDVIQVYNASTGIREMLQTSAGYLFDPTKPRVTNIAYIKTHKTGSTTLGSVFYRYGARHRLRFYIESHIMRLEKPSIENLGQYNIILQHHSGDGYWIGGPLHNDYKKLLEWYRAYIEDPALVTIVRDPVSHYLSMFYYYREPDMRAKKHMNMEPDDFSWLREAVDAQHWKNPLVAEFGVYDLEHLGTFLEEGLPSFALIMLTDRFEESLVVMRHLFNLDMRDLTFLTLNEGLEGHHRFDRKELKRTPHPDELDPVIVEKIINITKADAILYQRAKAQLDEKVEALKSAGVDVDREVEVLKEMNQRLAEACKDTEDSKEKDICDWYRQCDSCYERQIDNTGHGHLPEGIDDRV